MAAMDVSAVVTLCKKAFNLHHAGHRARSAEYYQRTLVAAQALGAEDCLIVAEMQLVLAGAAYVAERERRTQEGAPPFATMLPLFLAASATLQRRKAAGTLLAGCCRAAEVTCERLLFEHAAAVRQNDDSIMRAAAVVDVASSLSGYRTFLTAATLAYNVLLVGHSGVLSVTQEQLRACVVLMADAAEMVLQPRIGEHVAMGEEGTFVNSMQKLMRHPEFIVPHGAVGARLLDSWRRLEQSGVLQRRGAEDVWQSSLRQTVDDCSAAAAAAAAPGLRSCALADCGAREQHPSHFKSCAACRGVAYCCKEHQTADWPNHKAACKAARKAKEQQDVSGAAGASS